MAAIHGSLIPGNRGGKVLVVQNFRFHRHETKGEKMGYLPLTLVQMNFNTLVNGRRCRRLVRHYAAKEEFITYMRNTYICPGSTFPPVMWNVFERDMDQRTNNHVECE